MMAAQQYITGITAAQKARQWKLEEETVVKYATEASRRLNELVSNPDEEIHGRLIAGLETCAAGAIQDRKWGDGVKAILGLAGLKGHLGVRGKFGQEPPEPPRREVRIVYASGVEPLPEDESADTKHDPPVDAPKTPGPGGGG